jgi:TrmH family RNA methyltransferase
MAKHRIVLVEPKTPGNVGSVARVMKNFGQTDLVIVNGPELGDQASARALHAQDVMDRAQRVTSLEVAIRDVDYVVGTTARVPDPSNTYLRVPIAPREFPAKLDHTDGTVAILFGREDFGLFNNELELCDLLLSVPTSDLYRSLNLAQAVGIVCYELFVHDPSTRPKEPPPMSAEMRRHFQATTDRLIEALRLPEHQERNTKTSYRKVFGRAAPTAWEYYVLMGVFRRCLEQFGIHYPSGGNLPDFEIPEDVAKTALGVLEQERPVLSGSPDERHF